MDVEKANLSIDSLIQRRADAGNDANDLEEMWKAGEERHREKRRRENRALWCTHYRVLAASLRDRAAHYERKALQLCGEEAR